MTIQPQGLNGTPRVLFLVLGLLFQLGALGAWFFGVSCYGSTRVSSGGCLFGADAQEAALLLAWLGLVWFFPLMGNLKLVAAGLIVWVVGLKYYLFFEVLGTSLGLRG